MTSTDIDGLDEKNIKKEFIDVLVHKISQSGGLSIDGINSTNIDDDDKKDLEKEFIRLLTERINQSGGSLQFQHLSGALQQVRYEIREAFGTTKSNLMKFLRAHPNNFKVDAKGIVTVVDSTPDSDNNEHKIPPASELVDKSRTIKSRKALPEIKNGKGKVENISAEFGLILAEEPFETYVYFTPSNYNGNKESLFIDHNLEVNSQVGFNAVWGHIDQEIQYRALKVWKITKDHSHPENCIETNNFSRRNVDATNGHAVRNNDDSKPKKNAKPQTKEVIRNSEKSSSQVPTNSRANKKDTGRKSELIENQRGKIYPYKNNNGAVIEFVRGYSQLAAGDSARYFLYGSEVSDIRWEFSEGDDVLFDAIATKTAPHWKAILVWVGEKPANTNRKKTYIEEVDIEEVDDSNEDQSCTSVHAASSESSYSLTKHKTAKSPSRNFEKSRKVPFTEKKSNISFDHSADKRGSKYQAKYKHNTLEHSKNSFQKTSFNKSRSKNNVSKGRNFHASNYKGVNQASTSKSTESSSSEDNNSVCIQNELDKNSLKSSQNSSEDENEFQRPPHKSGNFQKGKVNTNRFKFKTSSEEDVSSYETLSENSNSNVKEEQKGRIRKFENISGKITRLYCKAALVKSSHLEKEIDFIINSFYLNGQSVDDQLVDDLKDVLKVGDNVNFNCFIIIDDTGETYQYVTMAWQGRMPENVRQMTPEEFIQENDLSVSGNNNLDDDFIQEQKNNFLTPVESTDPDYTQDLNSRIKSSLNIVSENVSDLSENFNDVMEHENESSEDGNYASDGVIENGIKRRDESLKESEKDGITVEVNYKLLSEKIIHRLKDNGCISSDEVDLSPLINEVTLVLKNSGIKDASSNQGMPLKSDSPAVICSECTKRSKTTRKVTSEVQTIITGEIVATSIYTEN